MSRTSLTFSCFKIYCMIRTNTPDYLIEWRDRNYCRIFILVKVSYFQLLTKQVVVVAVVANTPQLFVSLKQPYKTCYGFSMKFYEKNEIHKDRCLFRCKFFASLTPPIYILVSSYFCPLARKINCLNFMQRASCLSFHCKLFSTK